MWKEKERWTAAALLLAMVVVTGLCWYVLYIRQQFYDEGTRNLLETYEQVDKAFTIFSRSNWNMLNEWGKSCRLPMRRAWRRNACAAMRPSGRSGGIAACICSMKTANIGASGASMKKWITSGRPLRRCTAPASLRCPATSCGAGSAGWYTLRPLRRWRSTAPPTPALP